MLKRAVLATVLLLVGVPMLTTAQTTPLGVILLAVGLSMLVLPSYLRRTRTP